MRLEITGQNLDLTEALKKYINNKIAKLDNKFNLMNAHIVIYTEKLDNIAEANIHISGNNIFAKANDKDMYIAIDKLITKLLSQLKSFKEKNIAIRGKH